MCIYKARWKNALKKFARINLLLKKGYLIFDEGGNKVIPFQYNKESKSIYQETVYTNNIFRQRWFQNDKHYDHGLYKTINEFNSRFDGWTYINPQNINKLF